MSGFLGIFEVFEGFPGCLDRAFCWVLGAFSWFFVWYFSGSLVFFAVLCDRLLRGFNLWELEKAVHPKDKAKGLAKGLRVHQRSNKEKNTTDTNKNNDNNENTTR